MNLIKKAKADTSLYGSAHHGHVFSNLLLRSNANFLRFGGRTNYLALAGSSGRVFDFMLLISLLMV
jgi:hypothetical protein